MRLADQLDEIRPQYFSEVQARVHALAEQSRQMAAAIPRAEVARPTGAPQHEVGNVEEILVTAEYLTERYLEAVAHATDETTMNRAQALAKIAITRLASLRAMSERVRTAHENQEPFRP